MTHTWKILDLESITTSGLVTKVVYCCYSKLHNIELRKIGDIHLDGSIDSSEFIQYEELTEDTVLNWVDTLVNKSLIETTLSSSISEHETHFSASIQTNSGIPWSE